MEINPPSAFGDTLLPPAALVIELTAFEAILDSEDIFCSISHLNYSTLILSFLFLNLIRFQSHFLCCLPFRHLLRIV